MNNDLISRETLKKAITERCRSETECLNHFWYDENIIALIGNAQAVEITEEQAIDKLHETGWLIRHDKEMTTGPQGDCISRDDLRKAIHNSDLSGNREWLLMELDKIIDNAPTVHPRDNFDLGYVRGIEDARPKGEWIKNEHTFWTCSHCNWFNEMNRIKYNFCPNCGAKMKGGAK